MVEASTTSESPTGRFSPNVPPHSEIEKVKLTRSWGDIGGLCCAYSMLCSMICCTCGLFYFCEELQSCSDLCEICFGSGSRTLNQNIESPPDILKESPEVQEKINRCTCGVMSCTCCSCCSCCSKEWDYRYRPQYYASQNAYKFLNEWWNDDVEKVGMGEVNQDSTMICFVPVLI